MEFQIFLRRFQVATRLMPISTDRLFIEELAARQASTGTGVKPVVWPSKHLVRHQSLGPRFVLVEKSA